MIVLFLGNYNSPKLRNCYILCQDVDGFDDDFLRNNEQNLHTDTTLGSINKNSNFFYFRWLNRKLLRHPELNCNVHQSTYQFAPKIR